MKITVMVNRSNGNETVWNMWIDTYLFDDSASLKEVFEKIE